MVLVASYRQISINLDCFHSLEAGVGGIPTVSQYLGGFLSCLFLDCSEHRKQLFLVVGCLGDCLPDDQLQHRLYGNLGIVSLKKTVRPFQNARFRIGEVVLVFLFRLNFLLADLAVRLLCGGLGFLAGPCFQGTFGLANPLQPFFSSLQFSGQFVSITVPAITRILFSVDALGFLKQAAHLLFQPLLLLFHALIAHRLVLAGVRLQLAAVDGDTPQLQRTQLHRHP